MALYEPPINGKPYWGDFMAKAEYDKRPAYAGLLSLEKWQQETWEDQEAFRMLQQKIASPELHQNVSRYTLMRKSGLLD